MMNNEEPHHEAEVKLCRTPHILELLPQGGEFKLYWFENGYGAVVTTCHEIPILCTNRGPAWTLKIVEHDPSMKYKIPPNWDYMDALDEEIGEAVIKYYLSGDQVEAVLRRIESFAKKERK